MEIVDLKETCVLWSARSWMLDYSLTAKLQHC
jgi:hypothetical protein